MTLQDYLKDNKSKNVVIQMIANNGRVLFPMGYEPIKVSKIVSKELLNREFREASEEDDCIEIWVD